MAWRPPKRPPIYGQHGEEDRDGEEDSRGEDHDVDLPCLCSRGLI